MPDLPDPRAPLPGDDAGLVSLAADLLYDPDDLRAGTWPDPGKLGQLRDRLRGLAVELLAAGPDWYLRVHPEAASHDPR